MSDSPEAVDRRLMRLAIAIGRRGNGQTWPNPSVGAVLADPVSGRIIAQGVTQPGGRPHAEVVALAAAGAEARGATLYVSLEPCSHHGRTPPCADAIVAAGIGRVVCSLVDPDPRVAGRGYARIEAAGIALSTGVLKEEARQAHRGHLSRVSAGRPSLSLKLARTSDGYAARLPGLERLMISGERAGRFVHMLRAHSDAILVGVNTIIADDPRLDVRLPGLADRSPLPIVFDSHLRLPVDSCLVGRAGEHRGWVVCRDDADPEAARRLSEAGLEIVRVPAGPDERLDLAASMRELAARGLTRIFSEGGPTLADALAQAGLVDDIYIGTGSVRLGAPGHPAIGPRLEAALTDEFERVAEWNVDGDVVEHFQRLSCSQGS